MSFYDITGFSSLKVDMLLLPYTYRYLLKVVFLLLKYLYIGFSPSGLSSGQRLYSKPLQVVHAFLTSFADRNKNITLHSDTTTYHHP